MAEKKRKEEEFLKSLDLGEEFAKLEKALEAKKEEPEDEGKGKQFI